MKKFLPLIAALAVFGCAEEPADVDTTIVEPAETVTPPADDMMMDDTTMTDDMMMEDTTMVDGEMMEDTTSTM
ncbi:hypothetical protein [Rubrivirga marina]|nr:hypothetical protein [Rubrivirga marina]